MSKLYNEIYKLKTIERKGWLIIDAKTQGRIESDAEHVFSMQMLAFEIMNKRNLDLDRDKVLKMVLFHELGEIDAGDITPFDNVTKEEKYEREYNCLSRLTKLTGINEMLDLWIEFSQRKTQEAIFVYKMDKLDAIVQSKIYSERLNNDMIFEEFKKCYFDIYNEFKEFVD